VTDSNKFSHGQTMNTDASSNIRRPGTQGGGNFLDRLQSRGSSRVGTSDKLMNTLSPKGANRNPQFEQVDEESLGGLRQTPREQQCSS
jgi:hypothetical protein